MRKRGSRLSRRHPGHMVGVIPSHTTGRSMVFESSSERDFLRLCDFDPDIHSFRSQPFQIAYWLDGRERKYTPDALIEGDQPRLIEVKPERRTLKPEFRRWVVVIRKACEELGYTFEVVTDTEIRRQPRLGNVILLRRYRLESVPEAVELDVRAWVRETPGIRLGELVERLGASPEALTSMYGLLSQHRVAYDIHQPLGPELPVYPN